jgi:hypothetical protein
VITSGLATIQAKLQSWTLQRLSFSILIASLRTD